MLVPSLVISLLLSLQDLRVKGNKPLRDPFSLLLTLPFTKLTPSFSFFFFNFHLVLFFFFFFNIYLAALGLSCGMLGLCYSI